ncbi:MAG: carboxylesterase [Dehalococcoidia bacterium]
MMDELFHLIQQPTRPSASPPGLLVVHGWGADENDLLGLAPLLDDRFLVVSPRAPMTLDWGYGWYRFSPQSGTDSASFERARDQLASFAGSLPERYGIDPARLFVLGFSQGSVMGAALSLARPGLFRGAVLLSGRMPPLESADRLDDFPVFLGHGQFDPLIPVDQSFEMEEVLRDRGAVLTVCRYNYGHEITMETVTDINAWFARLLPDAG